MPVIEPYGIMLAVGLLSGGILCWILCKRKDLVPEDALLLMAYTVACGFLGAKLLYLLVTPGALDWSRGWDPEYRSSVLSAGFVYYGGLIGGALGLIPAVLIHKIDLRRYASLLTPGLALAQGCGRIGCRLAGCCYGEYWPHPGALIYESGTAPLHIPLFPVQMTEAIFCFCLCAVLVYLILRRPLDTLPLSVYALSYGTARFLLEFMRGDRIRGFWLGLSTSQWISILLILVGLFILLRRYKMLKA